MAVHVQVSFTNSTVIWTISPLAIFFVTLSRALSTESHGAFEHVFGRLDIGGARTALEALRPISHEPGFGLSSQCSVSAELYCDSIAHALKNAPVLAKRVSPEIKQLCDSSAAILSALDKSDAASIDGRMAIRPVFAATELAMYCDDLLRVAQTEDVKKYAAAALGAVIGFSNSLEACLRKADHYMSGRRIVIQREKK
ncbi:hypothetical protein BGZ74_000898 [Mortierella antarctica]|nr:hypothetical protein BGZ74_000898 [Mortierella antarctica]